MHPNEKTNTAQATASLGKKELFLAQKQLLDTFLQTGAITKAQYDKSLGDLTVKMGMQGAEERSPE
jgi:hypothetical protein